MKYCFTLFSVSDLAKASEVYGGLSLENISSFEKNQYAHEVMNKSIVDTIYIFSQLISPQDQYGGILAGSIYITNDGLYSIDSSGEYIRLSENSTLYIFRLGIISKRFYLFLKSFAKRMWNIDVIFPFGDMSIDDSILSSKVHGINFYKNPGDYIPVIIPAIDKPEDIGYLSRFIQHSEKFPDKIIIKKDGFWGGNGIDIFSKHDESFANKLENSIKQYLSGDFIIMKLIQTTDIEYRVYWVKENGHAKVLEVHGKKRLPGHILHNIAQGNELIRIDKKEISDKLIQDIEEYCTNLPDRHGGLDVITSQEEAYYFTENNAMTGYLYEDAESYFAKNWLDAVAGAYKE